MNIDPRDIHTFEEVLAWAISRAAEIHYGQVDKGGQPYILHPIRVMMAMTTLEEKIVAVLHDTIEDGGMTEDELRDYAGPLVTRAVVAISRNKGESYRDFILRVKENDLARRVKIADLRDNSDRSRIPNPSDVDRGRWGKYANALMVLEAV